MKNIISIFAIALFFVISGCKKDNTKCNLEVGNAPASEVAALEQYINDNNIDAIRDSRGFYYKINAAGSGEHPTICSQVAVNYKGTLTDGTVFDKNDNVDFTLSNLIKGWQAGVPLIAQGGSIILYLPPSFGYGAKSTAGIPANSILIFSIDLVKIY